MKISVDEERIIVLEEVFSGVTLKTCEGNQIGICMRDDTFEINVMPAGKHTNNWFRVNMQTETIEREEREPDKALDCCDPVECLADFRNRLGG